MNETVQAQLDRIETALTSLVDSIASYNPSIPAASNLLQADIELQDRLKQLQTHAQNTARITSLRNTIAKQNELITAHLTLLADTRAELLSTPSFTSSTTAARDVSYTDLLAYAKHIARFTTAPVGAFRARTGGKPPPPRSAATGGGGGDATDVGPSPTTKQAPGTTPGVGGAGDDKYGRGIDDLNQWEKQWLDPWTGVQVTPWPGEDVLKRGGLAELQAIVERGGNMGIDGVEDVTGEGGEEKNIGGGENTDMGDIQQGGEVDVATGGADVGRPENRNIALGQQAAALAAPGPKREEKPKVFGGLDLYDPDEEG